MAKAGQVLENPLTGDKLIFRQTSQESDGRTWQAELFYPPYGGKIPLAHVHPFIDEQFEILSGSTRYMLDGQAYEAPAGSTVLLPAGISQIHPWSISDEPLHMRQTLTLKTPDKKSLVKLEIFAETAFGLARDGLVDQDGRPHWLQTIVTLQALQPVGYVAGMPVMVQRLLFGLLALVGRALGYQARYAAYSGEAAEDLGMTV